MRKKAEGLTRTQQRILEYLKDYINENSFPQPSGNLFGA